MENDNVIPMSSRAIDLPVSPLQATSAEGELMHAPVVATLMEGRTVAGRLIGVDGPRAILSLEDREGRRVYVRFPELRYLNFIARNPINDEPHPLERRHADGILMPRRAQAFRISFTDRKVLTGRTRSSFVDRIGIHLFQLVDNAHVSRLFIPSQAVSSYYIGESRRGARPEDAGATSHRDPSGRLRPAHRAGARTASDAASLQEALAARRKAASPLTHARRIGEMLVEDGIVTATQLEAALDLQRQREEGRDRLGEILVATGATTAEAVSAALAHKFGMPFVLLETFAIDAGLLGPVPADIARRYCLIPLLEHQDRLIVALDDPTRTESLTLLRFMTQRQIEPVIATREDIERAIERHYGASGADQAPAAQGRRQEHHRRTMKQAVAGFVSSTIRDAIERQAADIRFAASGEDAELLFRIEGELVSIRHFSPIILPVVFSHLQAMAKIEPHHDDRPGQARILDGEEIIDVRVTLQHDGHHERSEARIELLRTGDRIDGLATIGLPADALGLLRDLLSRPGRLFVVAGPPDSHRSRTLYAALHELKAAGRRVLAAESPVTYHLTAIEQLHPGRGAGGFPLEVLASLPAEEAESALLLGELQSPALLNTSLDAARRGAVVLARLDAPSAAQAVVQLMELASDPAALGRSLAGVLVQHRVRVNCRHCMTREYVSPELRSILGVAPDESFYHGAGCTRCHGTGFCGSRLVFELLPNSLELATLVERGAPIEQIATWLRLGTRLGLVGHALRLARLRRIPLAEAHRLHLATSG